jgi:hypothetical protein
LGSCQPTPRDHQHLDPWVPMTLPPSQTQVRLVPRWYEFGRATGGMWHVECGLEWRSWAIQGCSSGKFTRVNDRWLWLLTGKLANYQYMFTVTLSKITKWPTFCRIWCKFNTFLVFLSQNNVISMPSIIFDNLIRKIYTYEVLEIHWKNSIYFI